MLLFAQDGKIRNPIGLRCPSIPGMLCSLTPSSSRMANRVRDRETTISGREKLVVTTSHSIL